MAMAGGYAIVPANGEGVMGSAQQPAGKSHRARVLLRAPGELGGTAWLDQEDAEDASR